MIKSASLTDELFVVLLPRGEVLEAARVLQKRISDFYNLYEDSQYPQIHITLDRIRKESAKRAGEIASEVVKAFSPVRIILEEFNCYHFCQDRFLVLKVATSSSLKEFSYLLHSRLAEAGLSTINNYNEWAFHITIVNNLFADNPIPDKDFKKLCMALDGIDTPLISDANRVEIWRPTLNPDEKSVDSFKLQNR